MVEAVMKIYAAGLRPPVINLHDFVVFLYDEWIQVDIVGFEADEDELNLNNSGASIRLDHLARNMAVIMRCCEQHRWKWPFMIGLWARDNIFGVE